MIDLLRELHGKYASRDDGAVASYIPELSKANPAHFGVSLADITGTVTDIGDAAVPFTLQSLSKPFVYGLALHTLGRDHVHKHVGVEPSGDAFDSIIELEKRSHRPYNPMVNAGAIAVTSLLSFDTIHTTLNAYAGRTLTIDDAVYRSEKSTGHRNIAIAHLLRHFDVIPSETGVDAYFKQCSVSVTTHDLALFAATLANGGVQPVTQERILSKDNVRDVLSLMFTCGMYDSAGDWAFTVGVPAKSGVSGGLCVVIPGKLGLALYSPRLDAFGHSVRGVALCQDLSAQAGLSLFDAQV